MFIAIVGSKSSGKSSIQDYLVSLGFTPVKLETTGTLDVDSVSLENPSSSAEELPAGYARTPSKNATKHLSFLSMNFSPLASPTTINTPSHQIQHLTFRSPLEMLDHVTRNWRSNFVSLDLKTRGLAEVFVKRPFFMLVRVDAPTLLRYRRANSLSLEDFLKEDDGVRFSRDTSGLTKQSSLDTMSDIVNIEVVNDFENLSDLHKHLDVLNLIDPDHLRPTWDDYFMTLASLASHRSNCMKRRVGAILVRERRIVASGYNGTPRGVTNCNAGGCSSCNGTLLSSGTKHECVCLHAEENALLEAGRERVGKGSVLYCNTCPCLKCTIKIIQTGVTEVVYNLAYKVDEASASLMKDAGVALRRYNPKFASYLPASNAHQQSQMSSLLPGARIKDAQSND